MELVNRKIQMRNEFGLHMRLASDISSIAHKFDAIVSFFKNDRSAELSSIFELLALRAESGDLLELSASGKDADEAMDAICDFLDEYSDTHLMSA
jgi:phosphocarrier protein NPr